MPELDEKSALRQASRLLKLRSRSEAEVRRKLEEKGFPEAAVQAAVKRLKDARLIDDARTAREWADGGRRALRGEARIRRTLESRGIAAATLDKVPAADEAARAWEALKRRAPRLKSAAPGDRVRKLAAYLGRQGFSEDVVEETIHRYAGEAEAQ